MGLKIFVAALVVLVMNNTSSTKSDNIPNDNKPKMVANRTDTEMEESKMNTLNRDIQEKYEFIFPKPIEWVLIAAFAVVFVIGLIGNASVCLAVYKNRSMRTAANYFIVNLAVADFLVILICLPPTVLWNVTKSWFFGTTMCRIVLYLQSVLATVSVVTMEVIALDRAAAVSTPYKFKCTASIWRSKLYLFIIWTLSLIFNLPELTLSADKSVPVIWTSNNDLGFLIVKALCLYGLPLVLMTVAYGRMLNALRHSEQVIIVELALADRAGREGGHFGNLNEDGVDYTETIILEYEGGKRAVLNTHTQLELINKATVYGTKGHITIQKGDYKRLYG